MEKIYFSTAYPPVNLTPGKEVWISDFDNITYDNVTDIDSNKFTLPLWRQILWYCLFVSMIIVATGGNLIVIWIVLVHKRMKSVTNIFLVNLSIADTLVSMLNVTFNFYYMLHSHWTFGNLYCKVSQFISVVTICASVFTLMAISIDRWVLFDYYYFFFLLYSRFRLSKSFLIASLWDESKSHFDSIVKGF